MVEAYRRLIAAYADIMVITLALSCAALYGHRTGVSVSKDKQ
jgi:hypothetical protein